MIGVAHSHIIRQEYGGLRAMTVSLLYKIDVIASCVRNERSSYFYSPLFFMTKGRVLFLHHHLRLDKDLLAPQRVP